MVPIFLQCQITQNTVFEKVSFHIVSEASYILVIFKILIWILPSKKTIATMSTFLTGNFDYLTNSKKIKINLIYFWRENSEKLVNLTHSKKKLRNTFHFWRGNSEFDFLAKVKIFFAREILIFWRKEKNQKLVLFIFDGKIPKID